MRDRTATGPARASTRPQQVLRALLCGLLLTATLVTLGPMPGSAVISAPIAIDGSFDDWVGVLGAPGNAVADGIGAADPDNPGSNDRDVTIAAATWDATYLYVYFRRTVYGQNAYLTIAYIDCDADGRMESTDRVLVLGHTGGDYAANRSGLYRYAPASPTGDLLTGDGVDMPGSLGAAVPGASYTGATDESVESEGRVAWASLGVPADSPVGIHFAVGQNTTLPGGITDNTGNVSLRRRAVSVSPAYSSAGAAVETTVTFTHTLTNRGNATETFTLALAPTAGWTATLSRSPGGPPIGSATLRAGESTSVVVSVRAPAGTAEGALGGVMLSALCAGATDVRADAYDEVRIGRLTVSPDRSASMAGGQAVVYRHTVSNNCSAPLTIDLAAASSSGWTTSVWRSDEASRLSSVPLGAGEATVVVVRVEVPPAARAGTQDVLSLTGTARGVPAITGSARDVTTVRPGVTVSPDNNGTGAAGTWITYSHTITNSWPTTRTFDLSAISSLGWDIAIVAADGVTPITRLTVGPDGATTQFFVRVLLPDEVEAGEVDVTTVTAVSGMISASATDRTGGGRLAIYTDPGYTLAGSVYSPGDTVYARGTDLPVNSVRFRWLGPSGATVYTSAPIARDAQDMAQSSYALPAASAVGTWTCVLLNGGNSTEIARRTFLVRQRASITALWATDAQSSPTSVTIGCSLQDRSSSGIAGSTLSYLIWWDTDGDGTFDAGDTYIDASGAPVAWNGSGNPVSRSRTGVGVPAGGALTDTWSLGNAAFPNRGTYRLTAVWTASGGAVLDTRTSSFFSIPSLGWPLTLASLAGAGAWLWRRRRQ